MTKQAMAELVRYLETHGFVTRIPDPGDLRAKLVVPTERGRDVIGIAQGLVPELEERLTGMLGADRFTALGDDLAAIRQAAAQW
jgi:DNA-binding MarR family transcriptional regulator